MQIVTDIRTVNLRGPTILTIGNFDGLHLGHQALLATLCAIAASHTPRAASALLTFSPHPLAVLRPDFPHHVLTTPEQRLLLAETIGIDIGIIQPFTEEIAALNAHDFVLLLKQHLGLAGLVVGPDFALGRGRDGDLDTLRTLGKSLAFTVTVITPQVLGGRPVRSSIIRRQLQAGEVAAAAELLGRPYHVTGVVKTGDRRGRQIGVPTANVQTLPEMLLPADGVYATRTIVGDGSGTRTYDSVTNLGVRPTVDGLHHRLETHLCDFPEAGQSANLYETNLTVEFWTRLRGEKRFDGLEALVAQIHADMDEARAFFRDRRS